MINQFIRRMVIMSSLKRELGDALVKKLDAEELFQSKLKPDIEKGKVFFAIRHKKASFYAEGRSLFSFEHKGFSTHEKFAFIPNGIKEGSSIYENQLDSLLPVKSFCSGYKRIKDRALQYADCEAIGVSALYKCASYEGNKDKRYYLVDIEVVFSDENRKRSKIDVLLYDNHKCQLLFCEVKHCEDSRMSAKVDEIPEVVKQLEKYNEHIATKEDMIVKAYKTAFKEYNILMGTTLNPPQSVYPKCGLYVFGFNAQQIKEFNNKIGKKKSFYGHRCKAIGGTSNDSAETIYKALT